MPVARVLTSMEENGIELDMNFLDQLGVEFANTIQNLRKQKLPILRVKAQCQLAKTSGRDPL